MARPKSEDKRNAIMAAAVQIVATQGLSATTAAIAIEASVSNGSLFTYFATKADLLNNLYVELKAEMASASLSGVPTDADIRAQLSQLWSQWLHWAASCPEKRRALAHLAVSDEITPESREAGHQAMAGIARLLERSRENGPMRDMPLSFVTALMSAVADTTIDFMIDNPSTADEECAAAFDALWRMVA